ncbi:uncharacterized protein LOC123969339 [Xyrichtys novacula]|uniref:Uncharacterized protein LOC123969339 n=1 Tax=Xyrichtys novacula TaxID=13765 RepID=A0AAV1EW98_XYRNO|nr:uncharacterized protein LOC123969339 [Xyrichtys novacula]
MDSSHAVKMKLLLIFWLLTADLYSCYTGVPEIYAELNGIAILKCPEKGNVTWQCLDKGGQRKILLTITNGLEKSTNKSKYGAQADNALLILKVQTFDFRMYFCNNKKVYLRDITDINRLLPKTTNMPGPDGQDFGDGSGQARDPAEDEPGSGIQGSSGDWKIFVGVVTGAALVLFVLLTLRFCSKRRAMTNTTMEKTTQEAIYEEIDDVEHQPRRESVVESPSDWSSIADTPNTSTPTNNNLYSTVNKTKGQSREECVYYLAQNPASVGRK